MLLRRSEEKMKMDLVPSNSIIYFLLCYWCIVFHFDGKFYIKVDEYFYDVDRTVIERHVFIEEDKYDDRLILSGHKGLVGFNCSLIKSIVIESTENFE